MFEVADAAADVPDPKLLSRPDALFFASAKKLVADDISNDDASDSADGKSNEGGVIFALPNILVTAASNVSRLKVLLNPAAV